MPAKRSSLSERIEDLRRFFRAERREPSYAEMMDLWSFRSKNAVFRVIEALEREGLVYREDGRIRFGAGLTGTVRRLGTVPAGFPSAAEDVAVDMVDLDEFLVRKPEDTFMLTVVGDSMIDAGIQEGDSVLVEHGTAPRSGDVVVARLDGEWTLKYYVTQGGEIALEPANPNYPVLRPRQSLEIGGVVRAVIRRYR